MRKGNPGRWWWNRIARLLPPYLAAVLITFLVIRITAPDGFYLASGQDLLGNLFLVQDWFPSINYVDHSYWTFPLQVLAFSMAALLWPLVKPRPGWLPALLWSLLVIPATLALTGWIDQAPQWAMSLYDGLGLERVHLFAAGVAIWLWSRGRLRGWHLGALLMAALAANDIQMRDENSTIALGVALALICVAAVGPDWKPLQVLARPITWLAGISFGVYLVHQELGYLTTHWMSALGIGPWGRLFGFLASGVLLGWLLTRYVERPVHQWLMSARPLRAVYVWTVGWAIILRFRLTPRRPVWAQPNSAMWAAIARNPGYSQEGRAGSLPEPSERPVSQASMSPAFPPTS